jgi:hypothetical protein
MNEYNTKYFIGDLGRNTKILLKLRIIYRPATLIEAFTFVPVILHYFSYKMSLRVAQIFKWKVLLLHLLAKTGCYAKIRSQDVNNS